MSWTLVVRPKAEEDLLRAFRWYQDRRQGLGNEFLEEVDAAFCRIVERPLDAAILYRDVRRVLVRRFPYGVFYVATHSEAQIIAVTHQSQDPAGWRRRT